jgi:hypothetical protein
MMEVILAVLLALFTIEAGYRTLRWMERASVRAEAEARRRRR